MWNSVAFVQQLLQLLCEEPDTTFSGLKIVFNISGNNTYLLSCCELEEKIPLILYRYHYNVSVQKCKNNKLLFYFIQKRPMFLYWETLMTWLREKLWNWTLQWWKLIALHTLCYSICLSCVRRIIHTLTFQMSSTVGWHEHILWELKVFLLYQYSVDQ